MKNKSIKQLFQTGFFHIFGSSTLNKIVAFLSSVVLVRILSKAEYGVFTYAWNIYSIVLLLNGFGMESGILQLCSEKGGDRVYMNSITRYGLRFGLIADTLLAVVLLGIGLFAPLKVQGSGDLLMLLCLLPMVQLIYNIITSRLRSEKRNQEYARLTLFNTVAVFLLTAGAAFLFRQTGMVVGYYAAYTASILLALKTRSFRLEQAPTLERSEKKALLSIGLVSMCNTGLSQLMYLLDVFVLGIVDPQETLLASYKVATLIPSALPFIPLSLIVYLYPYFAEHRGDREWCLKRYKQVLLGLGCVNAVISAALFLLAPWIVHLLFGKQYLDAVPVFRILSVNYFVSGTFRILSGNLLVTQRKLKFNLLVAIISSSANIAADFLFIRWWGSVGAALATVLVTLISSILSTSYLVYTFKKAPKSGS